MKYKYTKYIFLVFCFCLSGTTTFAAKTLSLRLVRVEITNNNNNCDEQCAWWTDKKMDWTFDVDDGSAGGWQTDVNEACQQMPGDNNDPGDWNANYIVWSNSYPFVCSWPSSSVGVDFRLEGWDRDCDLCVGGGFANVGGDHVCTVTVNPTFPSSAFSGTGGNLTYTCNFNSA